MCDHDQNQDAIISHEYFEQQDDTDTLQNRINEVLPIEILFKIIRMVNFEDLKAVVLVCRFSSNIYYIFLDAEHLCNRPFPPFRASHLSSQYVYLM